MSEPVPAALSAPPPDPPTGRGDQRIPRPPRWRLGEGAPWPSRGQRSLLGADEVGARIAAAGLDRAPVTPPFPDARASAVLVALVDGPDGAEVLLTKRSKALRNHSGEISFPGGRVDPGETPVDTALREAREEVGLPAHLVRVHGRLSHLATVVSRSSIVPVVGALDHRPPLVAHDVEVARILWVPLDTLADAATYRDEWWGTPPLDRRMHFFELDDETVWGATAHMLYELLDLVYRPPV